MKFKKSLSVLLTVLMVLSSVVVSPTVTVVAAGTDDTITMTEPTDVVNEDADSVTEPSTDTEITNGNSKYNLGRAYISRMDKAGTADLRIWGEVTNLADVYLEQFKVEFYNANNALVATTTLAQKFTCEGSLSWHLRIDGSSDTEWWTYNWFEGNPNPDNEPVTAKFIINNEDCGSIGFSKHEVFYTKNWKEYFAVKGADKYYTRLQDAIDAGETSITLLSDIVEKGTEVEAGSGEFFVQILDKEVTIDLGGHTFTGSFYLNSGAKLSIDNGSIVSLEGNASSCIESVGGSIVLGDKLNAHSNIRHTIRVKGGTAVINGGTYKADGNSTYHVVNISHAANVTIHGGTFISNEGNSAAGGNAVMIQDAASTVNIYGGDFSNASGPEGSLCAAAGLKIYGGSFDTWNYDNYLAEGKVVSKNEERYVVADAVVINTKTNKHYGTLQAAIDEAKAGETIKLLGDITEKGTEVEANSGEFFVQILNKEVTIDLGGHTFTGSLYLNNGAKLTIDNGKIRTFAGNKSSCIESVGGSLVLGDKLNAHSNTRHTIRVKGGTAVINGGTYKADGNSTYHVVNISHAANVTINGGTFISNKGNSTAGGNAVMIQDAASTVNIYGGDFSNASGPEGSLCAAAGLTIYGGSFDTWDYDNYLAEGRVVSNNAERYVVADAVVINTTTNKHYGTLQAAIDAANANDTIKLLGNITINAEDGKPETHAWVKVGQNVVIDLNGFTVDGAFFINGTATIKNGKIENKNCVSGVETQGNLTLENMTIVSDRHAIRVSGGKTTIISGTYKTNGTTGTRHTVNASGAATVLDIKGGVFYGAGYANLGASGNCVMDQGCAAVNILGGEFYGANGVEGPVCAASNTVISGGVFEDTTALWRYTATTAKGCVALVKEKKEGSTVYEVIEFTNWIQVADTSWYDENKAEFTISSEAQLAGLMKLVNEGVTFAGKTVTLGADLDLSGATYGVEGIVWNGIGVYKDSTKSFQGTFNGNGKKITNVTFADLSNGVSDSEANNYRGFFNQIDNATVMNLTVSGSAWATAPASTEYGGALIAGCANGSTISGCVAEGSINGTHNVAGVVVRVKDSSIINCTNKANLTGSYTKMGGIAALVQNSEVGVLFDGCINEGAITSTARGEDGVGGIVGWIGYPNTENITVKNCENKGIITATATATVGQIAAESWNYRHIFENNKGLIGMVATGHSAMDGLNFGVVSEDGTTVTYVKALEAGKTYLVTAPDVKPVIKLASGEFITFDQSLATIDATGITADTELKISEDGTTVTYKADEVIGAVVGDSCAYNEATGQYEFYMLSGIDSLNYKEVGYYITVGGVKMSLSTKNVYESVNVNMNGQIVTLTADGFSKDGYDANYIFVQKVNFSSNVSITYQAYAVKKDGTEILGKEVVLDSILVQ